MTREEAIERIKGIKSLVEKYDDVVALRMAVEALEQEPCEDAISRKAALDMATTIQTDDYSGNEIMEVVDIDEIKALPSVTPTRKKGKWIKEFKLITDGYTTVKKPIVTCSECSAENSSIYKNFCPNCGAEMESELNGN